MGSCVLPRLAAVGFAAAGAAAAAWTALQPDDAGLALLLVATALVAAAYAWLESGPGQAAELALIGALAGIAAAGRVLFAAVPGVQPVTVIVVAAGASLGARAGMAVGATAALVSNLFLGQGPWTPWQMLAWAGCGAAGAAARGLIRRRLAFAGFCAVLGLAFSGLMDVWLWFSFYPHDWPALVAVLGRGIPFDVAHAVGNLLIALAAGPELRRLLDRYGRRLKPEVVWSP
jgi:energy-coupling factor transport system substrate-specific component